MGCIRKRGNRYQIDYYDPAGKRVRKTFAKRKDAEAELGKRISLIAENRYLDVKRAYNSTLNELINSYAENFKHQKSFSGSKEIYLKNFEEYFGRDTLLSNIKFKDLELYRNFLRGKLTPHGTLRKPASINREMACLHHLFAKAVDWEMIEKSPFDDGECLLLKENNKRIRYLDEEEIQRLLSKCTGHLYPIVVCALNTGMRKGEILSLKWSQIRNGFIYLEETKTDEARQIPINETLAELFEGIRAKEKAGTGYVFRYVKEKKKKGKEISVKHLKVIQNEKPIMNVKNSFRKALKDAGIVDFRFHDLRHTAASQMIMHGANLKDVQEILGHKSMTMTLRYAHLSQEHKRKAVNLLNGLTASQNTSYFDGHKMVTSTISASPLCR